MLAALVLSIVAGCGARGGKLSVPDREDAGALDAALPVDACPPREARCAAARDLAVGSFFGALLTAEGEYYEWSVLGEVGEATRDPDVPPAVRIAVGREHRCLLDGAGRVLCWGRSTVGALGQGALAAVERATPVTLPSRAVDLSVSTQTSCAVLEDGRVYCWGSNRYRQLGRGEGGEGAQSGVPAPVDGVERAVRVAASPTHTCALIATHEVLCWGAHRHSQLGDGPHTTSFGTAPVRPVGDFTRVARLAVGLEWSCITTSPRGATHCWGEPASAPHRALFVPLPTEVDAPAGAEMVSLGDEGHACFLDEGAVLCFAYRAAEPFPTSARAIRVSGLADDIIDIEVGQSRACALQATGAVDCWAPNGAPERVLGLP